MRLILSLVPASRPRDQPWCAPGATRGSHRTAESTESHRADSAPLEGLEGTGWARSCGGYTMSKSVIAAFEGDCIAAGYEHATF